MLKWSNMRNGDRAGIAREPIERRMRAPAPSNCSLARKTVLMAREIMMSREWDVEMCYLGKLPTAFLYSGGKCQ